MSTIAVMEKRPFDERWAALVRSGVTPLYGEHRCVQLSAPSPERLDLCSGYPFKQGD
jgi:hypothetical protein